MVPGSVPHTTISQANQSSGTKRAWFLHYILRVCVFLICLGLLISEWEYLHGDSGDTQDLMLLSPALYQCNTFQGHKHELFNRSNNTFNTSASRSCVKPCRCQADTWWAGSESLFFWMEFQIPKCTLDSLVRTPHPPGPHTLPKQTTAVCIKFHHCTFWMGCSWTLWVNWMTAVVLACTYPSRGAPYPWQGNWNTFENAKCLQAGKTTRLRTAALQGESKVQTCLLLNIHL